MNLLKRFLKIQITNRLLHSNLLNNIQGGIAAPLILWWLGVPGLVVILLWLFVFRG